MGRNAKRNGKIVPERVLIWWTMKNSVINRLFSCIAVLLAGFITLSDAYAQRARLPLPLERPAAVYDETLSAPLSSGDQGSLVDVLSFNGQIYPPSDLDGRPHPSNTVLFTTRVGAGVDPIQMPGSFMASIIPRPSVPFFVRVYNAPTYEESTFYEDSDVHSPSETVDVAFYPALTATTNAIDDGDADNDGIHNSWERSLGLNMSQPDSDGDGVNDDVESVMGTDPLNANSVVPPFTIGSMGGRTLVADWDLDAPVEEHVPAALRESLSSSISVSSDPYANFIYRLQASDGLPGMWRSVDSGLVGEWPVSLSLPESTNAVQIYRVIMQVKE